MRQDNKIISCQQKNYSPYFTRSCRCRRRCRSVLAAPPRAAASPAPLTPPHCTAEQQPLSVRQDNKIISCQQKNTHLISPLAPARLNTKGGWKRSAARTTAATAVRRRGEVRVGALGGAGRAVSDGIISSLLFLLLVLLVVLLAWGLCFVLLLAVLGRDC